MPHKVVAAVPGSTLVVASIVGFHATKTAKPIPITKIAARMRFVIERSRDALLFSESLCSARLDRRAAVADHADQQRTSRHVHVESITAPIAWRAIHTEIRSRTHRRAMRASRGSHLGGYRSALNQHPPNATRSPHTEEIKIRMEFRSW